MLRRIFWAAVLVFVVAGEGGAATVDAGQDVFAQVNGQVITRTEFETAFQTEARQRFFHGRAKEGDVQQLRFDVLQKLIDRQLLLGEALKRKIELPGKVLEERYAKDSRYFHLDRLDEAQRDQVERMLRQQIREQLLLDALKQGVESLPEPTEQEVRSYYDDHLDKFTTPARLHLSVILLKVAPAAPPQAWEAARDEAQRLKARLAAGSDFGDLARLHSGDASAEQGGDLGFVHQGMLSGEAQAAVDALGVGEVSQPVLLLQGVALFRLAERQAAEVNPFVSVAERARALLERERRQGAWEKFIRGVRVGANIVVHDEKITKMMDRTSSVSR